MKGRHPGSELYRLPQLTGIRSVGFTALFVAAAILSAAGNSFGQDSGAESSSERRVALWGSSVANGAGDETQLSGYAGHLRRQMAERGWELLNQSKNGDNTVTIQARFEPGATPDENTRYLTSVDPAYVIIGLSLGNEGIAQCQLGQSSRCTSSLVEAEAVFDQFASGLQDLIARSRAAGITPVVALPYARSDFWEREYGLTRRMILLINSWDVPSVNVLGAVNDGQGRWARGLWGDPFHPNAAGHEEIAYSFVPSLFAALQAGKPIPQRSRTDGFARLSADSPDAMSYDVDDTMRSFALTFRVRPAADGPIASIRGQLLDSEFSLVRRSYGAFEWDTESIMLTPAEGFAASLSVSDGRIAYNSPGGDSVSAPIVEPGAWHDVTLTHYAGRGETLLYVDGEHIGSIAERLQPETFQLGGTAGTDYRDWMIHRGGLTSDEVRVLHSDKLLQASLEVYVPLSGENPTANRAQSLSAVRVDPAVVSFRID
jgi:lysophospholipase L1-like esterase